MIKIKNNFKIYEYILKINCIDNDDINLFDYFWCSKFFFLYQYDTQLK